MSAQKNPNHKKPSSFDIPQTNINLEEVEEVRRVLKCDRVLVYGLNQERYKYVKSIPNIYQANLTECHLEQLESFAIKSSLIAPIWQNEQLFGLLIGHQCVQTRSWKKSEIELFAQLALQSGLALEKLRLQEELFLTQKTYPNEVEKQPPKANNFPKKISELQKISQLIVENQTTLQQLKLKISHQSTSKNSLINPVQDINQEF